MAHDRFEASGSTLRAACGPSYTSFSHSLTTDLVDAWTDGIHGEYGSALWVSMHYVSGRSSHYACGLNAEPAPSPYKGIGLCSGPGAGGSWGNHEVSFSMWGSGVIGCDNTQLGAGEFTLWHRPD